MDKVGEKFGSAELELVRACLGLARKSFQRALERAGVSENVRAALRKDIAAIDAVLLKLITGGV